MRSFWTSLGNSLRASETQSKDSSVASWSRRTCAPAGALVGIERGSDERRRRDLERGHIASRGVAILSRPATGSGQALAMSRDRRDALRRGSVPGVTLPAWLRDHLLAATLT